MAGTGGKSCASRLVAQRGRKAGERKRVKRRKRHDQTISIVSSCRSCILPLFPLPRFLIGDQAPAVVSWLVQWGQRVAAWSMVLRQKGQLRTGAPGPAGLMNALLIR